MNACKDCGVKWAQERGLCRSCQRARREDGSIPSHTLDLAAVQRALMPVCYAKRWMLVCNLVDELSELRAFRQIVVQKIPKTELAGWGIEL
jgi:hypothetical protein